MKLIIGLIIGLLICYINAQCEFPSDWTGTSWFHSLHGQVTFYSWSRNYMDFNMDDSTRVRLNCNTFITNGPKYLVSTYSHFRGTGQYIYACLEIIQLKSSLYKIIHRTPKNSAIYNYRYILTSTWYITITEAAVCTDYTDDPDIEYYLMMKIDDIDDVKIDAPSPFAGSLAFTVNNGSCSGKNVSISSCSNKTLLDIDGCSAIGYSSDGQLNVVYSTTSGDTYTIWTYNRDTAVNNIYTYKFTCWIATLSEGTVNATQNPQFCDASQTSTTAATNGIAFTGTLKNCSKLQKIGPSSKYCKTCSGDMIYCDHGCCNYECCPSPVIIAVGTVSAGVILSVVIGGVIIYIVQNRYNRVPITNN